MTIVSLECRCGEMRGTAEVSPTSGNHAVCYCRDCQAFAHYLGTEGILDSRGGTDVFQMTPARVTIDTGATHLACARLTKKGLFRWYASCCRTPVANTLSWARLPFVGIVQPFMRHPPDAPREDVLGPVRTYANAHTAVGGPPPGIPKPGVGDLVFLSRVLVGGAVRGEHQPSPFFGRDGKPSVTPYVLSAAERAAL